MTSRHLVLAFAAALAGRVADAAEPKQPARYGTLASLKALECVESWEQLCSPPADILEFAVFEDRVEVTPHMDDTAFVFRMKARSGGLLDLELGSCSDLRRCAGKGQPARLMLKSDGHAVFEGPDVYGLLDGRIELIRLELVSTEIYNRTSNELERKYVPGGKCEALMGYERSGHRPCLNAPGRR